MKQAFVEGLLLQASLIFAIGAQNLFVLEAGIQRRHHVLVSVVCYLCDFLLIMLGVAGAATLFTQFPQIKIYFGILGVLFLFYYGVRKLRTKEREIILGRELSQDIGLKDSVIKAMTFSLINPHAYLDGIVLIGGYSTKYDLLSLRVALGFGASTFSLVWFLGLSSASAKMKPLFQCPRRMRYIMSTAGVVLIFLSAKLSMDVVRWIEEDQTPSAIALQIENQVAPKKK